MKIVHLAANPIVLGDRVIQRCFICGMKLADNLGSAVPVEPDGTARTFSTWGVGAWVENEGNRWCVVGQSERPQMSEDEIPEGCCLSLVED